MTGRCDLSPHPRPRNRYADPTPLFCCARARSVSQLVQRRSCARQSGSHAAAPAGPARHAPPPLPPRGARPAPSGPQSAAGEPIPRPGAPCAPPSRGEPGMTTPVPPPSAFIEVERLVVEILEDDPGLATALWPRTNTRSARLRRHRPLPVSSTGRWPGSGSAEPPRRRAAGVRAEVSGASDRPPRTGRPLPGSPARTSPVPPGGLRIAGQVQPGHVPYGSIASVRRPHHSPADRPEGRPTWRLAPATPRISRSTPTPVSPTSCAPRPLTARPCSTGCTRNVLIRESRAYAAGWSDALSEARRADRR
ncbi:hypothetical protein SFUMM280S_08750 [Streptomyces fumanus]